MRIDRNNSLRLILRGNRACHNCRERHLKCDDREPACDRCTHLTVPCVRDEKVDYIFEYEDNPAVVSKRRTSRKRKPEFTDKQTWTEVPKTLTFVNVHLDNYTFEHEEDITDRHDAQRLSTSPRRISTPLQPSHGTPILSTSGVEPSEPTHMNEEVTHDMLTSISTISDGHFNPEDDEDRGQAFESTANMDDETAVWGPLDPPGADSGGCGSVCGVSPGNRPALWPLKSLREASILRHFIEDLSTWFDYCDPDKQFSTTVVRAAANSPAILYAILAVSAKHLSISKRCDPIMADQYQRSCLEMLVPALNRQAALEDDELFATTLILRLLDEMTGLVMKKVSALASFFKT